MRWIVVLAGILTGLAYGQEPVLRVQVAATGPDDAPQAERVRLVEYVCRLTSDEGMTLVHDPAKGAYRTEPDPQQPEQPDQALLVELDANAWRRADPDAFVPGPMNVLLGVFGLADVRRVAVVVDGEGEQVVARWDRRPEDPRTTPMHERVVATRLDGEGGETAEVWRIEGLGIGRFVVGALRSGLAVEEGERKQSDRAFGDFWLRGRSTLLNSLERASTGAELVITEDLRAGVVFRFDRAVKARSLQRASLRIVPAGVPTVTVLGMEITPAFTVAMDASGAAVVVVAPTEQDLAGVLDAMAFEAIGGEAGSGGDGP